MNNFQIIRKQSRLEILYKIHNEILEQLFRNQIDIQFYLKKADQYNTGTQEYINNINQSKTHEVYVLENQTTLQIIDKLINEEKNKEVTAEENMRQIICPTPIPVKLKNTY